MRMRTGATSGNALARLARVLQRREPPVRKLTNLAISTGRAPGVGLARNPLVIAAVRAPAFAAQAQRDAVVSAHARDLAAGSASEPPTAPDLQPMRPICPETDWSEAGARLLSAGWR
jgi:hypothetical protein